MSLITGQTIATLSVPMTTLLGLSVGEEDREVGGGVEADTEGGNSGIGAGALACWDREGAGGCVKVHSSLAIVCNNYLYIYIQVVPGQAGGGSFQTNNL